jgi:hypothetical protein
MEPQRRMDARVKPGHDDCKKSNETNRHTFYSAALSSDFT